MVTALAVAVPSRRAAEGPSRASAPIAPGNGHIASSVAPTSDHLLPRAWDLPPTHRRGVRTRTGHPARDVREGGSAVPYAPSTPAGRPCPDRDDRGPCEVVATSHVADVRIPEHRRKPVCPRADPTATVSRLPGQVKGRLADRNDHPVSGASGMCRRTVAGPSCGRARSATPGAPCPSVVSAARAVSGSLGLPPAASRNGHWPDRRRGPETATLKTASQVAVTKTDRSSIHGAAA